LNALPRFALLERGRQCAQRDERAAALAESQFSAGGSPPPRGHLLHREEGIDLSLSRAARTQVLAEKVAITPVSEAHRLAVGSVSMKIWS